MKYEMLKKTAERITMPEEMKCRIASNCKKQILESGEDYSMKNYKNRTFWKKPAAVIAVLAVCVCLSVTALAGTGVIHVYFRDIKNVFGAVVGTAYDQATEEIDLRVAVSGETLTALVVFSEPGKAPYNEAETLRIEQYRIIDAEGSVVKEGTRTAASEITNGQAAINIPLNDLESGSYKLIVTAFVSEKKADQPLTISGTWECAFTK